MHGTGVNRIQKNLQTWVVTDTRMVLQNLKGIK